MSNNELIFLFILLVIIPLIMTVLSLFEDKNGKILKIKFLLLLPSVVLFVFCLFTLFLNIHFNNEFMYSVVSFFSGLLSTALFFCTRKIATFIIGVLLLLVFLLLCCL